MIFLFKWRAIARSFGFRRTATGNQSSAFLSGLLKLSGLSSKPGRAPTTSSPSTRRLRSNPMSRAYKESDFPKSRKRVYDGERRSKRRPPALTPLEEYIEKQKEKERQDQLARPFDDPMPF